MSDAVTNLPVISDWPYQEVYDSFLAYQRDHQENPCILWVGQSLWALLLQASDSTDFLTIDSIPIKFDKKHILEPHEFMFTRGLA